MENPALFYRKRCSPAQKKLASSNRQEIASLEEATHLEEEAAAPLEKAVRSQ